MFRPLAVPLLLLVAGALGLAAAAPPGAGLRLPRPSSAAGLAIAAEVRAAGPNSAVESVMEHARKFAERLDGFLDDGDRSRLQLDLDLLLEGLGLRPDAPLLPWEAWLEQERVGHPRLAPGLLRAAGRALGSDIRPLALAADRRDSPVALRVAALQLLWIHAPSDARHATARLLREPARHDLHERVVAEVLAPFAGAEIEELLLSVIGDGSRPERARRLAVEALGQRRAVEAVPYLGQILSYDEGNLPLRKAAGEALFRIGTPSAWREIAAAQALADTQPTFAAYLDNLRGRIGLPPLG